MTRLRGENVRTVVGVVITAVYLLPVYWMLNTSFKAQADVFERPPALVPLPPTFAAYQSAVFGDPDIGRGLANTAVIATGTTLLTLIVAVPAAYALARLRLRFVTPALLLFLAVQMIPAVNLALPMFVLFGRVGLVNTYAGLIIANCSLSVPLAITIMRPYFLSVPGEVLEAARVDGCTAFGAFVRIALPISIPGVITMAVVGFLGAWGEFVFGLALATGEELQPVSVVIAKLTNAFGTRWNELMAVSAVVAVPVIVLFVLLQRYIVAGLTDGATKG
jgi:multiple sugar transport system permease protein